MQPELSLTSCAVCLAAGAVAVAQEPLWSVDSPDPTSQFHTVRRIGDVDADGVADFGIGCVDRALMVSGADGSTLHVFFSVGSYPTSGPLPIAAAGDIDHDGFADVAVGMQNDDTAPLALSELQLGSVRLFSGKDGALLRSIHGASHAKFGGSLESLGDVNGDGTTEIAVAQYGQYELSETDFTIEVISCGDGTSVYSIPQPANPPSFQAVIALANIGDPSGDGISDFLASHFGSPYFGNRDSRVLLYSGADGQLLHDFSDPDACVFGSGLGKAGDLDGDGTDDLLIGTAFGLSASPVLSTGIVRAYSGATFEVLWSRDGSDPYGAFGVEMTGVGDLDLDGSIDVAAPESNRTIGTLQSAGMVHLFAHGSGHSLGCGLDGSAPQLGFGNSIAAGGDLDADGFPDLAIVTQGTWQVNSRVELRSLHDCTALPDRFLLGSELHGSLGAGDPLDDADFECLAGTKIRLSFQVTSGDLRVRIELQESGANAVKSWTPKSSASPLKKSFTIASDGSYQLRIIPLGGTQGNYSLRTSLAKQPKLGPGFIKTVSGTGASKPPKVSLRALAGTQLYGSVEGVKGLASQVPIELVAPNGQVLDLSQSLDLSDPDETQFSQLELPTSGTYEIRTAGAGGHGTKAKFVIDILRTSGSELLDID